MSNAQIKELMSQEAESGMVDNLMADDDEEEEKADSAIKLEKHNDYVRYGKEVGEKLKRANRIKPTQAFFSHARLGLPQVSMNFSGPSRKMVPPSIMRPSSVPQHT